jgi:hypothetical protein
MRIRKTLMAILALAIAIAFSPLTELRAASLLSPDSKVSTDNLTITVAKKGRKGGKRAKSKGPGHCGTYKYYSKKKHKCVDARDKK